MDLTRNMRAVKRLVNKRTWYKEARLFYLQVLRGGNARAYMTYAYYRFLVRRRIRAAKRPLDLVPTDDAYSIHLLCSHQDVGMLLWAIASWCAQVPQTGQIYVHEDGTFTDEDRALIARVLPKVRIIDLAWATEQARTVWLTTFPNARRQREAYQKYVFIIKLIDPLFVSSAPARLILDTDILWFAEPTELLSRLHEHKTPFMQFCALRRSASRDSEEGSMAGFTFTDGTQLDPSIHTLNSGIVGYHVEEYVLADLETFCGKIDFSTPFHFYEQVGYGWILSRHTMLSTLEADTYVIREPVQETTIARHYTGPRRDLFSSEGVRLLCDRILGK